jgi:hypothetical protein
MGGFEPNLYVSPLGTLQIANIDNGGTVIARFVAFLVSLDGDSNYTRLKLMYVHSSLDCL